MLGRPLDRPRCTVADVLRATGIRGTGDRDRSTVAFAIGASSCPTPSPTTHRPPVLCWAAIRRRDPTRRAYGRGRAAPQRGARRDRRLGCRARQPGDRGRVAGQQGPAFGVTLEAGHVILPGSCTRGHRLAPATTSAPSSTNSATFRVVRVTVRNARSRRCEPRSSGPATSGPTCSTSCCGPRCSSRVDGRDRPCRRTACARAASLGSRPPPRASTGCWPDPSCRAGLRGDVGPGARRQRAALRGGRHPRHRPDAGRRRAVRASRRSTCASTSTRPTST